MTDRSAEDRRRERGRRAPQARHPVLVPLQRRVGRQQATDGPARALSTTILVVLAVFLLAANPAWVRDAASVFASWFAR